MDDKDCAHENVRVFRALLTPYAKCLDCGQRVSRQWVVIPPEKPQD